ncbi:MAG: hypothetical protein V1847_03495 [Candidatus Diapherotrites archaeon]
MPEPLHKASGKHSLLDPIKVVQGVHKIASSTFKDVKTVAKTLKDLKPEERKAKIEAINRDRMLKEENWIKQNKSIIESMGDEERLQLLLELAQQGFLARHLGFAALALSLTKSIAGGKKRVQVLQELSHYVHPVQLESIMTMEAQFRAQAR